MKIAFVEIEGFRGFRERTRFEIPPGFAVFNGRNGVGKSTVLDAIDFALTGTINKFSVREAKGGGLDRHLWWLGKGKAENYYVSVGFISEDGEPFVIRRSRDRGYESTDVHIGKALSDGTSLVTLDTLIQTTLIRDELISSLSLDLPEQARFTAVRAAIGTIAGPDLSSRTDAIQKAADAARLQQAARVQSLKEELSRALTSLTEARSLAQRSSNVAEALRLIESVQVPLSDAPQGRIEAVRNAIVNRRIALSAIQLAQQQYKHFLEQQSVLDSESHKNELRNADEALGAAKNELDVARRALETAKRSYEAESQTNTHAAHLAKLVEHGTAVGLQEGHCPLCRAIRSNDEFSAAIEFTRTYLASAGERLAKASTDVRLAQSAVEGANSKAGICQQALEQIRSRQAAVQAGLENIRNTYLRYQVPPPKSLAEAEALLNEEQEKILRLERAIYMLEASTAIDIVKTTEARVSELRVRIDEETGKYSRAEKAAAIAKQIDSSAKMLGNEILAEHFDTVMPLVKELYRRLRPHGDWTEIEVDFGGKVRASLNFLVGDGYNPQFLFSSGQRRAAGLAFLLAVHLSRPWCRWNTLLLDDPVQHIDDYRALNLVEVLGSIRRSGRQVVVAVEDSALADVLCRRLRSDKEHIGRRFELGTSTEGTATVLRQEDIYPMPYDVLLEAKAS